MKGHTMTRDKSRQDSTNPNEDQEVDGQPQTNPQTPNKEAEQQDTQV